MGASVQLRFRCQRRTDATRLGSAQSDPFARFLLWGLLYVVSYIVGSYDLEVGPAYGIRLRTGIAFFTTALVYLLLTRFVLRKLVPFPYGFWIALFIYLNLLSPPLALMVGRLYRISTLCVGKDMTEEDYRHQT